MRRFLALFHDSGATSVRAEGPASEFEGCRVFWRGHIANRCEILAKSDHSGDRTNSADDGALFAKAYRWWGADIQRHVLGEFAVAILDIRESSLLFTHDTLGIAPAFYAESPDGLYVASNLDDLISEIGRPQLDEEYIADYLATSRILGTRTPFLGVSRLGPGQCLQRSRGRTTVTTRWSLEDVAPLRLRDNREYEERLLLLLREAVASGLQTNGKVWCELSGGLDSSTVTMLAAATGRANIETISIIPEDFPADHERQWIEAITDACALPSHKLDSSRWLPFSELPENFVAEPISVTPVSALLARYATLAEANGVKVVLTGVGGDSVLCGDAPKPYFLADLLPLHPLKFSQALRIWRGKSNKKRSLTHDFLAYAARPLTRYMTGRNIASDTGGSAPRWINPDYARRMALSQRGAGPLVKKRSGVGRQYHAERILCHAYNAASFFDGLNCTFEFRNPLMYLPLIEFMFAIPWEHKIEPGLDRSLQRRALKGILPEIVRQRHSKGGGDKTFAEGLRKGTAWTDALLKDSRLVKRGYVDAALWTEAVNRARHGVRSSMKDFLAAATLEIWLRQLEARSPRSLTLKRPLIRL